MQDQTQITIKQAAKMCSVTTSTLYKMVRTGRLPQTTKGFLPTAAVAGYKQRLEASRQLLSQQEGEDDGWERKFGIKK